MTTRYMYIVLTGSRKYTDRNKIYQALWGLKKKHGKDWLLVHGGARGADQIAGTIADTLGIRQVICPANWTEGKHAGVLRNQYMLDTFKPLKVLAFPLPDGALIPSVGTLDCIARAKKLGIEVVIYPGDGKEQGK